MNKLVSGFHQYSSMIDQVVLHVCYLKTTLRLAILARVLDDIVVARRDVTTCVCVKKQGPVIAGQ